MIVAIRTGTVSCQEVVDRFDSIVASPTYNVSGSNDNIQSAYNQYRQAISTFSQGAKDMAQNCRDYLADPRPGSIPFQQWGVARQRVNDAVTILNSAIPLVQ